MRRRRTAVFVIAILMLAAMVSGAFAQSDWWLKGNSQGDKKNTYKNVHVGDVIVFGQYKKASLEWQVLEMEKTKALVFCTKSLASLPYNPVRSKFVTWEDCTLRKWLNEFYLSDAFSKTQRKRIQLTAVDNSSGQHRDIYRKISSQPDTEDYIYLLSWKEVKKYCTTKKSRSKDQAWWTRSPGEMPGCALQIEDDGAMTYGNGAPSNENGVYPVLWLNLE